ncbi:hypothetical protein [Xanthomonas translucens]|uniref:hypothetical protein n=2 Tax=Xanthomonas campestris pv. translucens TaxID=343 RepID=UPI0018DED40E|nr:hypothetical protein [Xanthomonas translucens]UKE41818.1 hypothetical protein KCU58_08160 [Xanthomonas translucens pv. undulosa]
MTQPFAAQTVGAAAGHAACPPRLRRAPLKDWASQITDFPDDRSEAAIAHEITDKAKAAYKRGKMLEKWRKMMEAWASYCASSTAQPWRMVFSHTGALLDCGVSHLEVESRPAFYSDYTMRPFPARRPSIF